VSELPL
jgi:metacaspase-1